MNQKEIRELPDQEVIYESDMFALDSLETNQTGKITYNALLKKLREDILKDLADIEPEPEQEEDEPIDVNAIRKQIADVAYPVGSIYMCLGSSAVDPATLFGGTWVRIEDKFLLAAGTKHIVGEEDTGAETVKLSGAQSGVPIHTHSFTRPTVSSSGGGGTISGGNHNHNATNYTDGKAQNYIVYNFETTQKGISRVRVNSTNSGSVWVPYTNHSGTNYSRMSHTADATHTHTLPNHTHALTGGGIGNATAKDATEAHNNMPPYVVVNIWQRTA